MSGFEIKQFYTPIETVSGKSSMDIYLKLNFEKSLWFYKQTHEIFGSL
jgi:hypothetical protein